MTFIWERPDLETKCGYPSIYLHDIALGMLTIPNLIAIVILCPQVRRASKDFFDNHYDVLPDKH